MEWTEDNVEDYIRFVNEHEIPEPPIDKELAFLAKHGDGSDKFADTYMAFAANLAINWHNKEGRRGIGLYRAIKEANIGLMYAKNLYIENSRRDVSFKKYATPIIEDRLNALSHLYSQ